MVATRAANAVAAIAQRIEAARSLAAAGHRWPGHTEMLADAPGLSDVATPLVCVATPVTLSTSPPALASASAPATVHVGAVHLHRGVRHFRPDAIARYQHDTVGASARGLRRSSGFAHRSSPCASPAQRSTNRPTAPS